MRGKFKMPVLPVAVYLNVGLDGIGIDERTETFADLDVVTFRYLYVGLRALDGLQYLDGENLLGVSLSSLMRVPPELIAEVGVRALAKIADASIDGQRKYLLAECVEAYLELNDEGRRRFAELIGRTEFKGAKVMNKTTREKGREEGHLEGARQYLLELLEERFGQIAPKIETRIQNLPEDEVSRIFKAAIKAPSLADLGLES